VKRIVNSLNLDEFQLTLRICVFTRFYVDVPMEFDDGCCWSDGKVTFGKMLQYLTQFEVNVKRFYLKYSSTLAPLTTAVFLIMESLKDGEESKTTMASFSHGKNINFHAAKIVSPVVNLGSLAYRIRFFDSANEAANTNRYVDQLRPFVKKGDLVMADWRLGEPYEARITKIHIPSSTSSSSSASTLPAIKVNVKFIADGETLSNLPITRIKVPKAKAVEKFTEKKKKRGGGEEQWQRETQ